jgi:hypothetical protein
VPKAICCCYSLISDYETRLASAAISDHTTSLTYDGNATLVKEVMDGQTTVYVGNHYEKNVTTGHVTRYYFFGSQRIAMRKAAVVQYVLGGHPRLRSGQAREAPRWCWIRTGPK